MTQGRVVLLQLVVYLTSVSVVLAYLLLIQVTVWALIVGRLAGSVVELAGSHLLLSGPRCRLAWDRAVVLEILHFGKWIFISTGCTFLAEQADRLIIGRVASLESLGVYNLAVQLALAAKLVVNQVTLRVVFPLYSRVFQSGVGLATIFRRVHPWAAGFAAFAAAGLISAGPAFVKCLFRQRYEAAGWMLQLVALGTWVTMLEMVSACLLWVLGNARGQALGMMVKLLAAPLCAWGGNHLAGLPGMILGFGVAELLRYGVTLWVLRDQRLPILRYDLCLSAGIAISVIAATRVGSLFEVVGAPDGPGCPWRHRY